MARAPKTSRKKQEPIENPIDDPSVFLTTDEDDFEGGEDPVADRFAEAENDPRVEDLRDRNPGPVDPGRFATPQQMPDGSWQRPDSDNVGRPVMVPLWEHAHIYPSVTQLRVWRSVNGNLHEIGAIACKSNMEEFIETFWHSMPKEGESAGLFEARAMDAQGNFVGKVFQIGPIDANHITLRRMRAAKAGVQSQFVPVPQAPAGLDLNLLAAIKTMFVDPALEQAKQAQEEARAAREARDAEARRISDERINLAQNTGATVENMSNKLLETAAEADRRRAKEQSEFFTAQQLLEKSDRERERLRYEDERRQREEDRKAALAEAEEKRRIEREEREEARKRDRDEAEERRKDREHEYQQKLIETRERYERDRKDEEARAEARRLDEQRRWERERDEARRREEEREADRKRQHEMMLAQLEIRAKQDREHAERMLQLTQKDSPEGAIGSLSKALAPLGIDVKELAVPFIQRMMNPEAEFDVAGLVEGVGKVAVDGFGKLVDYAKTMKAIEAQKSGMGGHPVMGGAAQQQIAQVQQVPQQGPTGAGVTATPPAGTPVSEPTNAASSLPLDMQRACRAALRQAVNEMRQTPEDKWPDIVSKAFATEAGLYHWFKQLTIRGALKDIQVEAAFIDHILNHPALNNPLLAEVPRG